jgi:hypothetical protein
MDRKDKAGWRRALRELRRLQTEYDRVVREKAAYCTEQQEAAEKPRDLIELRKG